MQARLGKAYLDLWASAAKRLTGEDSAPVVAPEAGDKRFADPEWSSNQFYDFLKQAYLLSTRWARQLVADAADLDPHTRLKAEFYVRQITNAVSPSNFVLTNPELLRETVAEQCRQPGPRWRSTGWRTRSALEMQNRLGKAYLDLGHRRQSGSPARRSPPSRAEAGDKRFPIRNGRRTSTTISSSRLICSRALGQAAGQRRRRPRSAHQAKAEFYVRQITNAVSPSNFVLTNPELLRETVLSNADNLVRGMRMLAEDIETGGGDLKIRQSDASMFAVGRNLATTPGKVIFQNELMQLIQYAPSTPMVLKRPLLIVPPWINKFYVLDLTAGKILHQMVRRPGHHGVRHLLGQSRRPPRQEEF